MCSNFLVNTTLAWDKAVVLRSAITYTPCIREKKINYSWNVSKHSCNIVKRAFNVNVLNRSCISLKSFTVISVKFSLFWWRKECPLLSVTSSLVHKLPFVYLAPVGMIGFTYLLSFRVSLPYRFEFFFSRRNIYEALSPAIEKTWLVQWHVAYI